MSGRAGLVGAVTAGALAAGMLAVAGPAVAQASPDLVRVSVTPGRAGDYSGASVSLAMRQQQYADISVNVGFEGFTAVEPFAFAPGSCPGGLVVVDAPVEVFKCGWVQDGDTARLRMALRGTFDRSRITVTFAQDAMITPARPGTYAVQVSGWSFDDVEGRVTVRPGPCADDAVSPRGDVVCP